MATSSSPRDQRKFSNFLKTAGLSKSYYLHVFAGGVAFFGILMIYVSRLLSEVNQSVAGLPDSDLAALLQDRLFMVAVLIFICFISFLTCTVFYMVILGQRVGGPVVAICSYIRELKAGNFEAKRTLRKNDELTPILKELQELAEVLKAKKELH